MKDIIYHILICTINYIFETRIENDKYMYRLHTLYIDTETGNVYSDTNKRATEYKMSKSECIRNTDKNVILKTICQWANNFFGNYVINDEIIQEIREIEEKCRKEKMKKNLNHILLS